VIVSGEREKKREGERDSERGKREKERRGGGGRAGERSMIVINAIDKAKKENTSAILIKKTRGKKTCRRRRP